jgi:hypothetical protein
MAKDPAHSALILETGTCWQQYSIAVKKDDCMKVGFIQCTEILGFYGIILYEYTTQMMVPSFWLLSRNKLARFTY